ncbi:MAG: sulfatase [Armatimonadota bacterium]|nr:sulfatase [Armatimonadota bacterium]
MSTQNISRRQFIAGAGAAAISLPFINIHGAAAAQERPNFVFILTDDQRFDAMSCAGHPFLHTPNIDRLANEGARFTNAFVTTALCSPSRASFLTGRYVHSHGIVGNGNPTVELPVTFPQVLQNAGYDTAYVGKWHMGNQEGPRPGFNRWVSFKGQGVYWNPTLNVDGEKVMSNGYMTDLLSGYAVDWLKQSRKSPFCLYLAHKAVHSPLEPAHRHRDLFSDVAIPHPKTMHDDLKGKPEWIKPYQKSAHGLREDRYEQFIRNYNRLLVAVDESVGQVLTTLSNMGTLDNTIVVFTSDNGYFQGEHGMIDKRAMYEESIRIPLLMRYPKMVRPGALINQMVLNIDVCPTFCDIAGEKAPDGVQGKSLKPLLKGKPSGWRSDFLYEYFREGGFAVPDIRGVRTERWKYIEYPNITDTSELYDLKNDSIEMRNLIDDPKSAKTLADMRARLQRLVKETA